jgi:hypothetical protein
LYLGIPHKGESKVVHVHVNAKLEVLPVAVRDGGKVGRLAADVEMPARPAKSKQINVNTGKYAGCASYTSAGGSERNLLELAAINNLDSDIRLGLGLNLEGLDSAIDLQMEGNGRSIVIFQMKTKDY